MTRKKTKNIRLISTSISTGTIMDNLFKESFPEADVYNIIDDSIVREIIYNKDVISTGITKRLCAYVISAELSGSDFVVICCSTISGIGRIVSKMVSIPVVCIDEPMAELAVQKGKRIKILATMSSTLKPSIDLLQLTAEAQNKDIILDSLLCSHARNFLDQGKPEKHDLVLLEEIQKALKENDIVVLAQASMARVLNSLEKDKDRVYTSPPIAVKAIRKQFF
jgi:Asp/Glu/hydantoin racemase